MKILISILVLFAGVARAREYHVGVNYPLKTISAAAELARPGDTVTVHAGIYRERVNPPRGGTSDGQRITYQAAKDEQVIITGSEAIKNWERVTNDTWKVTLPNSYFGDFNPFARRVAGEWCSSTGRHTGMVYLNGNWFAESLTLDPVLKPVGKEPLWFAKVDSQSTTIWAQFPGVNPNEANVEINVRQCVFYPSKTGINYITVRGFEMRQAATPWAGAMSEQVGLVGTHWSKGWIIENNHIHHSMCTGITLGRYELPKGKMPPATAPGYVKSIELALRDGWSKEKIGSHIVRMNHIHHCEKNGIHGSLGACFSEISGNDIHDISVRGWVRGDDTAGIKFLGGVDMVIRDNHIYRCGDVAGIWLDWMAQGAVVTGNLLHDNTSKHADVFFEMQHGPLVFANNILLSPKFSFTVNSKGMAIVHNLVSANIYNIRTDPRDTPYHHAHATTIAGLSGSPSGDHRFYNNLFIRQWNGPVLDQTILPCFATGNVFTKGAQPSKFNTADLLKPDFDADVKLTQKSGGWYLTITEDKAWRAEAKCKLVRTESLGKAKIPGLRYENPDGTPLAVDTDYFGKPRDKTNPFPGPFEAPVNGEIRVWPKP